MALKVTLDDSVLDVVVQLLDGLHFRTMVFVLPDVSFQMLEVSC